eukprot:Gb_39118 [translate_table: standard]
MNSEFVEICSVVERKTLVRGRENTVLTAFFGVSLCRRGECPGGRRFNKYLAGDGSQRTPRHCDSWRKFHAQSWSNWSRATRSSDKEKHWPGAENAEQEKKALFVEEDLSPSLFLWWSWRGEGGAGVSGSGVFCDGGLWQRRSAEREINAAGVAVVNAPRKP